ncbi:hypothetical protein A7975_30585 [Bacillus sp. FJAT-26390]|nr:hypothetical protein A7975_30585 [Bacillus sp. FJAT-26390]
MAFGGVERDRIGLNEHTLWSGMPKKGSNGHAIEVLSKVRELVREGRYAEADITCKEMMGPYTQSYLPFGDLHLTFGHGDLHHDYSRSLDLENALVRVEYRIGNIVYTREMFVSHPDQVLIVRLEASVPGALDVRARLDSALRHSVAVDNGKFVLRGLAPEHVSPNYHEVDHPIVYGDETSEAMCFSGYLHAEVDGGMLNVDAAGIHATGATRITLYFSGATSYNGQDTAKAKMRERPRSLI